MTFTTGLATLFTLCCPLDVLFKRYVLARFAVSRVKLNTLWQPKEMLLGELYAPRTRHHTAIWTYLPWPPPDRPPWPLIHGRYAQLTRLLAIGIVYAPLDPTVLGVVFLMLLLNYGAMRFAIANWYAKPGNLLCQLSDRMRAVLAGLLVVHVGVMRLGLAAATGLDEWHPTLHALSLPIFISLGLLALWYFSHFFFGKYLGIGSYDELAEAERDGDDTGGRRYDSVYGIERYFCPTGGAEHPAERVEAEMFRRGFAGGFVDETWTDLHAAKPEVEQPTKEKPTESTPLVGGAAA